MTTDTTPPAAPAAAPNWAAGGRLASLAVVAGFGLYALGGVLLAATGAPADAPVLKQLLSAWTTGWVYWVSLPLGGMALLMIHYLARSSWGLLLRRPLEAAARTLPVMVVLFLPVAAGAYLHEASPYWWAAEAHHEPTAEQKEAVEKYKQAQARLEVGEPAGFRNDELAQFGAAVMQARAVEHERKDRDEGNYHFLSPTAFVGVAAVVFLVFGLTIYFLTKWSGDSAADPARVDAHLEKAKNLSGPGLIVYAILITAAATHWVMSLQEGWASTMFPVIFAVNQFLTCLAFSIAVFLTVADAPVIREAFARNRPKFQLDLGTFMLALTLFWSYTSFSQMMLIWIGNLPEEIPFFLKRSDQSGWWWVSAGLIGFHFVVPFLILLFRAVKLHRGRLRGMAVYILLVCAVDVVWWVEPSYLHGSPWFVLMDVGAVLGIGGLWGLAYLYFLKGRPLFPANETYFLPEGHDHVTV